MVPPIPVGVGRRERSSPRPPAFQLPRGLICSRVLFHVYMKALHMVWHRVQFHQYADATRVVHLCLRLSKWCC